MPSMKEPPEFKYPVNGIRPITVPCEMQRKQGSRDHTQELLALEAAARKLDADPYPTLPEEKEPIIYRVERRLHDKNADILKNSLPTDNFEIMSL